MSLYLPSGYPDIAHIDSRDLPFNIITGGRGTGKTYGLLKYYLEKGETIIYMRRTGDQADMAGSEELTPYKSLCENEGMDYDIPKGKVKVLYIEGWNKPTAYFIGLSTISNIRGFDGSDCSAIVYDEFIPERQARKIKDEGEALLNAYETVNRNRELYGKPPLKLWLLSNTNDIMSPVLKEFNLLKIALEMEKSRTVRYVNQERGLQIVNLYDSPISEQKSDTALYRLAGEAYKEMALKNSYKFDQSCIKSHNLISFIPVATIGEITIYKHKSKHRYYCTTHRTGNPPVFGTGEKEVNRFFKSFGYLYDNYVLGYMDYETIDIYYIVKAIFET